MPVDRNRPRAIADAVTSPSALLLAGAGASAAILAGAPLALAAVAAAGAWAVRVAIGLPKTPREEAIEPGTLTTPWRNFVADALRAHRRFADAVNATPPGPLRDTLGGIGERVTAAVRACWSIARRGEQLARAVRHLEIERIRAELDRAERNLARAPDREDLQVIASSLRDQLASAERLEKLTEDTIARLRRLDAELDEAVARAVELSLSAPTAGGLDTLSGDVEAVVDSLEALRRGLEEAGGAGRVDVA